jgi:hypothetical protein
MKRTRPSAVTTSLVGFVVKNKGISRRPPSLRASSNAGSAGDRECSQRTRGLFVYLSVPVLRGRRAKCQAHNVPVFRPSIHVLQVDAILCPPISTGTCDGSNMPREKFVKKYRLESASCSWARQVWARPISPWDHSEPPFPASSACSRTSLPAVRAKQAYSEGPRERVIMPLLETEVLVMRARQGDEWGSTYWTS